MKVVITTMIWQRPAITSIWCEAVKRLIKSFPQVEFNVLVAGSEGVHSRTLIEWHGFDYIETPNAPLANKANLRLQACKKYNADYILFLGSDDVMNNKTFEFILSKMQKGFDEIAPMDLYIYDTVSKTLVYSRGYINHRKGERLAIGRAVKCSVLDRVGWSMWKPGLNTSLDGSSREKLNKHIRNPYYYWLKANGLMIIDIKSKVNMGKFVIRKNHTVVPNDNLNLMEEHKLIRAI